MEQPLVSVILPTYNGLSRGFLNQAIESVLNQTYFHFEFIIVDDGSVDNLQQGCSAYLKDKRVRIFKQKNQGLSGARKSGIEQAQGEYIALIDDDDLWAPDKLQKQVEFLSRHPDPKAGMTFSGVRLIDAEGQIIGVRTKPARGDIYRQLVLEGNGITAPSAVMMKKEVLNRVGNFDPDMRSLEDLDMWLRVAQHYHIYATADLLTDYRVHNQTITAKFFDREEEFEKKLYDGILAREKTWDQKAIYSHMYGRFAIRHMSLGNYNQARVCLNQSRQYRFSFKFYMMYLISFFPANMLDRLKVLRRKLKMIL